MNATIARRDQLINEGYCVVTQLLSGKMLQNVRQASNRLLDENSAEEKKKRGQQGNVVSLDYQDPVFSELIAMPAALEVLTTLGFAHPRYFGGAVIAGKGGAHRFTGIRTGRSGGSLRAPTRFPIRYF